MKTFLAVATTIIGAAFLVGGVTLLSVPAGMILGGGLLMAVGLFSIDIGAPE